MGAQQKTISAGLLAIVLPITGCAEVVHISSQEAAHTDSSDLGPLLEPIRKKYDLPALAGAVILEGRTAAWGATGFRKAGSSVKVTSDDKFHIGSCTKAMTATIIAMLVERGKLKWDTTLVEALPDIADEIHPGYRDVTLKHLLAHRSGLPPASQSYPKGKSFTDMHNMNGPAMEQRLAYTKMILREEPRAEPGMKYIYSNAGYAIAGVIAEQAMNTPWETLMRTMLFNPLGMTTAGFGPMGTPGKIDQPLQHVIAEGSTIYIEPNSLIDNPPAIGPAATVHCSIRDWAKFIIAHLKGAKGEGSLLKSETFKILHTPDFGGSYASGWDAKKRDWAEGEVLMHTGSNTMSFAVVWMAPKRDFAVLAVSNQGGCNAEKGCEEAVWMLIKEFLLNEKSEKGR